MKAFKYLLKIKAILMTQQRNTVQYILQVESNDFLEFYEFIHTLYLFYFFK